MKCSSRILKRFGAKAAAWDQEFKTDTWDQETKDDPIYPVLKDHYGSVLEMGCGSGLTPAEMHFTTYTGVDISSVAIAKAKLKNPQHQFDVSSMESYLPDRKYDVILFRESIYYVKRVSDLLNRLDPYLEPEGVFIARICNRDRHRDVIAEIRRNRSVKETIALRTGGIIMVFKEQRLHAPSRRTVVFPRLILEQAIRSALGGWPRIGKPRRVDGVGGQRVAAEPGTPGHAADRDL